MILVTCDSAWTMSVAQEQAIPKASQAYTFFALPRALTENREAVPLC